MLARCAGVVESEGGAVMRDGHWAYLFASIDTATARIVLVSVMSDERPTNVPNRCWAMIGKAWGHSFQEAREKMLQQMQLPYLKWCLPLMPPTVVGKR